MYIKVIIFINSNLKINFLPYLSSDEIKPDEEDTGHYLSLM